MRTQSEISTPDELGILLEISEVTDECENKRARKPKDVNQGERILKLYEYLLSSHKEGIWVNSFLEEEDIIRETLKKDILCINQFLEYETELNKRAAIGSRKDKIQMLDKTVDYVANYQCSKKKKDYSRTEPYRLLKLKYRLENNKLIRMDQWILETGKSERTFKRYISKINMHNAFYTDALEEDVIKVLGSGWCGKAKWIKEMKRKRKK